MTHHYEGRRAYVRHRAAEYLHRVGVADTWEIAEAIQASEHETYEALYRSRRFVTCGRRKRIREYRNTHARAVWFALCEWYAAGGDGVWVVLYGGHWHHTHSLRLGAWWWVRKARKQGLKP